MTKREEIDRILTRHTGKTGVHLDVVKRELSKAGVVVKADRDLPEVPITSNSTAKEVPEYSRGYAQCRQDMASCFEPLIKEE